MCRVVDLRQAVLAKNDASAHDLRARLAARGTTVVNLLSSPGSGKTALLERELLRAARERSVPVAALTADLATENDAAAPGAFGRPGQAGAHRRAVSSGGGDARPGTWTGWLPDDTRLLFVENVGNLVCPASYDLGETLRVVLASVTEGEDKPLKYPTAFGLAHLVRGHQDRHRGGRRVRRGRVPRERGAGQPGSRGGPDLGTPGAGSRRAARPGAGRRGRRTRPHAGHGPAARSPTPATLTPTRTRRPPVHMAHTHS